jgi:hypothetical protein
VGDEVGVSGTVKSGSYYLRAIQIEVRRNGDSAHGFKLDRKDFTTASKTTSYSLSGIKEFVVGATYPCTGCNKEEKLDVGSHTVIIYVGLYDENGNKVNMTDNGYDYRTEITSIQGYLSAGTYYVKVGTNMNNNSGFTITKLYFARNNER